MDYVVRLGETSYRVRIDGDSVQVDGVEVEVDLAPAGVGPIRSVRVTGESLRVHARREGRGAWRLGLGGAFHRAEVMDPGEARVRSIRASRGVREGPSVLRAPMPGRIVGIEVEPGDRVEAGQAVIRMEAMKMENELGAPERGSVRRVLVSPGEVVERDRVLAEFDAPGSDG